MAAADSHRARRRRAKANSGEGGCQVFLRILIPLTLLWPVLALAAEGTALRRYRASPARELGALAFCIVIFFALWIGADRALEGAMGSAAGLGVATGISLLAVPLILLLGYKLCGVKPDSAHPSH